MRTRLSKMQTGLLSRQTIQSLSPVSIWAMSTAILFQFVNIFGLRLGPKLIGAISGSFVPRYGDGFALRISVTIVTLSSACSAYMFLQISKSVVGDWRIVEAI